MASFKKYSIASLVSLSIARASTLIVALVNKSPRLWPHCRGSGGVRSFRGSYHPEKDHWPLKVPSFGPTARGVVARSFRGTV